MTSIINLPAIYTIALEFVNSIASAEYVIRLNGKFILSHPVEAVAKNLARVHAELFAK